MAQRTEVKIEEAIIRACIESALEIMLVDFESVDVYKEDGYFKIVIETKEKQ